MQSRLYVQCSCREVIVCQNAHTLQQFGGGIKRQKTYTRSNSDCGQETYDSSLKSQVIG